MSERLTRRFIIRGIDNLNVSSPIRYKRYYINNNLRIQQKNNIYEKEILNDNNVVIQKIKIDVNEFEHLKNDAYKEIIRDSYLYLDNKKISIKKYYGFYDGLIRAEVEFKNQEEMKKYKKEVWMGEEITESPLAFDKYLSKLSREEFLNEMSKYI